MFKRCKCWKLMLAGLAAGANYFSSFAQETQSFTSFRSLRPDTSDPDVAATLIIYNTKDPASLDLAAYYARKRGISADHIVGLDCPVAEEISRVDYDATIAKPLQKIFDDRGWWILEATDNRTRVEKNEIHFVALMRGIPLKIAPIANPYPGDQHGEQPALDSKNEASVDSELAALGYFTHAISGALQSPYYRSYTRFREAGMPLLMLVCRLDAPVVETVRRMIDDAIETERHGLWGFAYVDARGITGGGMAEGDAWLKHIADAVQRDGIPVIFDNVEALFPAVYPMRNVALYYGWYSGDVSGPFAREDFRFNKGAVACHIHSFSASTLRDPHRTWAAPLLVAGAAVTTGNVYEPYLTLTPNLDILDDRLRAGFTFGESAYMSQRVVSWMTTFVGDPLYRPFKIVPEPAANVPKPFREWAVYRDGALDWFRVSRAVGEKELQQSGRELHSGVVFEALGLLQASAGDLTAACQSFEQAQKLYTHPEDILRAAIHEVGFLKIAGKPSDALELAARQIKAHPDSPFITILRAFEKDLEATPAATKIPDAAR